MTSARIDQLLEAEGVVTGDLFCTVHAANSDRLATIYSSHPLPEVLGGWQPLSSGIIGEAVVKGHKVRVDDVRSMPHYWPVYPGVWSELAIPVVAGGQVTGVVNFESTHPAFFSDESRYPIFLKLAAEIADYFAFPSSNNAGILLVPETELLKPLAEIVRVTVSDISATLLAELSRQPSLVYSLTPRDFEKLIARLLSDQGYSVQLTPAQKDGGYDVLARIDLPAGPVLTLVECKRWSPESPVTVELIRNLYGVLAKSSATNAMIATTSYFTKDARAEQSAIRYELSLKDFQDISGWLRPYFGLFGGEANQRPQADA